MGLTSGDLSLVDQEPVEQLEARAKVWPKVNRSLNLGRQMAKSTLTADM